MTRSNSKNRGAKAKRRKPEKLEFVQPFLPVKDIRNGIVETTDGRYIKNLEIEPINFMLRSSEEQYNILSSFASWLKISPMKLQFKSITRKADSDKHVAMIRKELESEENEQCKALSEDYIRLIKDVGSREALTLNARTIPVATGRPSAQMDVELIMEKEIPVEMGFTEQGWFQLRMPMLLPQKGKGGSQYIRGFLYPAMMRFMRNDQRALRYKECILIYRHVYSRTYDERKYRDHDNIELNMVTDTVAVRVMADDSPMLCRHYYCSAVGDNERTEVYVIPRSDFFKWLEMEDHIPESGLKVENNPSIFAK